MVSMPPEGNRWLPGVRVVNLSGEVRDLVWEWGSAQAAAWLPDGKRIVFIGQPHGKLPGSKNDLWLIDRQGGEPECRSVGLKVGVGGSLQPDMPVWGLLEARILPTKDGKYAFVGVQDGGTLHVYKAALGGKELLKPVVAGECACLLLDGNADHLLYAVSTLHDPTNLYISRANGSQERQLTCLNDEWLSRIKQPEVERLLFPSSDGVEVEGWIMKPPTGKPPYPTILYIHGGPYGAWGNIFSFDFQMLAGAGYAVLFLNYRGSSGYSDEFATAIQADWGNLDYQDHMAGVDYVIAKGIADADRLGVCGLSAGGYGTCSIIGKTNRFKAAMPENPVTNLVSLYGVSDIGQFVIEMMGGKPHERAEVFAVCSPLSYAHDCTTPTLLVQGEADRRCPADQSEQFYAVLKDNGCIVEMLRLPGCSHIGTIAGPPVARRVANEAMLAWMDRYVLGAGS
jgi:dipeptidyl aminopeptidase/acylaminoacyl peptidase